MCVKEFREPAEFNAPSILHSRLPRRGVAARNPARGFYHLARGEIVSKVGSSVKIGTEASEAGAGARKGSSGSRGVSGGNAGGVGNG